MERALNALGAVLLGDNKKAAAVMYEKATFRSELIELGLVSIGSARNGTLTRDKPEIIQITWDEVKGFIFERFHTWEAAKRPHPQWDKDGHGLWQMFQENRYDADQFAKSIILGS